MPEASLPSFHAALQHNPRPLPLFLHMLREQTAASPERRAAALAGLRAYQEAPRGRMRRPAPARFRKGRARLRDYGAPGGTARAVVFVPSLINPPFVLDLAPGASLLRWLAGEGFRPFLLDWGTAGPEARDMDLAGHVERLLLPLLAKFERPPVVVGYCLGGTLAVAAGSAVPLAGLATIAAPWRFSGFPEGSARSIAELWEAARPTCETLGMVPMEVLQSGFWRLDPARTIAKYEAFSRMTPGSEAARAFVVLEDWANAGAPIPLAAGREMFEDLFAGDASGQGRWRVAGRIADPAALGCPAVEFVSLHDRIVPAATAIGLPDRRDLGAGHVGMVVGRTARAQLWEPLADWLSAIPGTR